MKHNEIKTKLSRIADELADIADLLPDDEARALHKATYAIDDVRLAVGEMVQVAAHQKGQVGPVAFRVIRGETVV